jgi:hypothetical protein
LRFTRAFSPTTTGRNIQQSGDERYRGFFQKARVAHAHEHAYFGLELGSAGDD